MRERQPPSLAPAVLVLLILGTALAALQNLFIGLAVLGMGVYLGSVELNRQAQRRRCPQCHRTGVPPTGYCPHRGAALPGG